MTASVDAARAAVQRAQTKLDELLAVKQLLKDELPAARSALEAAQRKLQALTKPSPAAVRRAEREAMQRQLDQAKAKPNEVENHV
ncbi:hypothetical protein D9M71_444750 [compost metagenome]